MSVDRQQKDLALWQRWKAGDEAALSPLMGRFQGQVNRWAHRHKSPNVPFESIRAEANLNLLRSFKTYDPSRKAGLGTHAAWQMRKGSRYVGRYADTGTMPEERRRMVGRFKAAMEELDDKLGRPPSLQELREYFKADMTLSTKQRQQQYSLRNLARLQRELRRDTLPTDFGFGVDEHDTSDSMALDTVYADLTPRDQKIFEHKTGYMGQPVLKNVEIARMLKVSPTTVGKRVKKLRALMGEALR